LINVKDKSEGVFGRPTFAGNRRAPYAKRSDAAELILARNTAKITGLAFCVSLRRQDKRAIFIALIISAADPNALTGSKWADGAIIQAYGRFDRRSAIFQTRWR